MRKRTIAALVIVAIPAAVAAYAATKPDTFRVERSTTIQAPPEAIAAHITDFHRWEAWSPYEKLDPAMKKSYSGAEQGPGAIYAWEGSKAGTGRMEIRDASSGLVRIQLDFSKPFEAHNTAEFTLQPEGDGTRVTWAMHGPNPFMSKVIGVFMDMDELLGKDFASGLANLKAVAEAPSAAPAATS